MGKHHHPRRLGLPAQPVEAGAHGVAHDDLFEADPGPEAQRPGAQTADGTGRHLDDHQSTVGADPHFGMDRALPQPHGGRRRRHRGGQRGQHRGRLAGRGDIDRLLEEGTVERVGLVEDRQHLEDPVHQEGLDRHLGAGDEALDQDRLVGPDDGPNPLRGG